MPFLTTLFTTASTALGSFFTAATIGRALVSIGLNVAMSFVKGALFGPKKQPSGVDLTLKYGEKEGRKVLMGTVAEGGHAFYDNTYGPSNKYWQQAIVLSDFPCTALKRVWVDDELVSLSDPDANGWMMVTSGDRANLLKFKFYNGWQTAADPDLVAKANPPERWTENHLLDGMCYVVAEMTFNREKATSAPKYTFEVDGAPLYDWRYDSAAGGDGPQRLDDASTWVFSKNPVIMALNYCYGLSWKGDKFCGMGIDLADLPLTKYTTGANICDEIVDGEARFVASISVDCGPDTKHRDNIEALMQATGGFLVTQVDGIWPIIGTSQPVVAVLNDDDFVVGKPVTFQAKRKYSELVNSISGTFPNPDNQWSPAAYKAARDPAVVTLDRSTRDINMSFATVPSKRQASQLAATYYAENRLEATMQCTVRPRWQVLEAGDWVRIESSKSGSRVWMVGESAIAPVDSDGPRNVQLNLQERGGEIYAPVAGINAPVIPLPPGQITYTSEMPDFNVLESNIAGADGRIAPAIRVSWSDANDPTIAAVRVEYRVKQTETQTQGEIFSEDVPAERRVRLLTAGVVSNTVYEVRQKLVTDPVRTTTPSAWEEVVTLDTPNTDISVSLAQANEDITGSFSHIFREVDRLTRMVETIAGNSSVNTLSEHLERKTVEKSVGKLGARVTTEVEALVDADAATASSLTQVEAKADAATAGGLFEMKAMATPAGISSRIGMFAYSGVGGASAMAGFFGETYMVNGTLKGRAGVLGDQFLITDSLTGSGHLPFSFQNGVATLNEINVVKLTVGPNGEVVFGQLAPGVFGEAIKI